MSGRMKRGADAQDRKTPKIVSSEHLAQDEGWELSEYEYGLIVAHNAFTRWMARCLAAVVGHSNFSALDDLELESL